MQSRAWKLAKWILLGEDWHVTGFWVQVYDDMHKNNNKTRSAYGLNLWKNKKCLTILLREGRINSHLFEAPLTIKTESSGKLISKMKLEERNMIDKTKKIGELLEKSPEKAEIFLNAGMQCLGCPASQAETLEEACAVHGIDVEELLAKLNA